MTPTSPITTHILDLGQGRPASGVTVSLAVFREQNWHTLAQAVTDQDGRIATALVEQAEPGIYRLSFDTGGYFQVQGKRCFYPQVQIEFELDDATAHYHVPLLLNQWGYSTYRGS